MTTTPASDLVFTPCSRCSGEGVIRAFAGVAGGVCFGCRGEKGKWETRAAVSKRRAAAARRAKAREAAEASRLDQLDVDRRDAGLDWAAIRTGMVEDDRSADYMLVNLWAGHEDHPRFPGMVRADGSPIPASAGVRYW